MKRILSALAALACAGALAYAANITPTPIVPPTETGENSAGSQQVTDTARMKLGSCNVALGGTSGTCNFASGVISSTSTTLTGSGAAQQTITLANTKVQAGDMVQCTVDQGAAAAASVPVCAVKVTAGQIVFILTNASSTSTGAFTPTFYFQINTQGNPN